MALVVAATADAIANFVMRFPNNRLEMRWIRSGSTTGILAVRRDRRGRPRAARVALGGPPGWPVLPTVTQTRLTPMRLLSAADEISLAGEDLLVAADNAD